MTTTRATPRELCSARSAAEPPRPRRFALAAGVSRREAGFLAGMLALAAVIRIILAAHGWPYANSDEATIGLMVDDILRDAAHPAFTYGEHHVGALDAYLQAPAFLALGHTNLALHVTTTIQYLLFLLVLYAFTRAVFSPRVAVGALLLLAVGGELALLFSMRAGHHEQDTLLLGTLLLWLTFLRLRERGGSHPRRARALDAALGLTAGLALWSTILLVPFVAASALALGVTAYRRHIAARRLAPHLLLAVISGLIGLAPLLVVAIQTRGVVLTEVLRASGAAGSAPAPGGPLGPLAALGQQFAGTFIFGLPSLFGSRTLCGPDCPLWPSPLSNPSPADALRVALIGAAFSALFIVCWWLAARPLLRDLRRAIAHLRAARALPANPALVAKPDSASFLDDPRWWGRALLVLAVGWTVLQYAATRSSYANVDTAPRYVVGAFLAAPLIAAPLVAGASHTWAWLRSSAARHQIAAAPPRRVILTTALLLALCVVQFAGAVNAFQETADTARYGVPAGARETTLLTFLDTHHATRFYTTWWVCYRLMFAAGERATCYVVSDTDPFHEGHFNRVPAYADAVTSAPHPAYLFDLTTDEVDRRVPAQLAGLIAAHDPRFAGYTAATVGGYVVFYYAGP